MTLFLLTHGTHVERTFNDRDKEVFLAQLTTIRSPLEVWFSFVESWTAQGKDQLLFKTSSIHFFIRSVEAEDEGQPFHQAFRLEWEGCRKEDKNSLLYTFPAPGAGHPHWQFDPWLTASDQSRQNRLRELLLEPPQGDVEPREFTEEYAENQVFGRERIGGPNLGWFTKVHFPTVALWPQCDSGWTPEDTSLPHTRSPASSRELHNWAYSALTYMRHQCDSYMDTASA